MFSGCAFKKITFPPQIKEIGMRAFSLCYELEEVIFNEGLEVIQKEAFQNCPNLLEINLPASIKKVGTDAFVYNGSYSHIPDMNINITTIPENLGLAITHPGNTYGVRCVNVHIDNRNGIFDFVLPCSVSVIVGARTNIIINQMADCKYAKKLSGLRYLETAYMNASNSMYKYAVAYKTYKKVKNKCAKEFLLDNQKHVAKAIILEMEEKDFADFVKLDFINLKYDEDIVKCLEERNWNVALQDRRPARQVSPRSAWSSNHVLQLLQPRAIPNCRKRVFTCSRQRPRIRSWKENVQQNLHTEDTVTESLEFQSHSLTSTTQHSLKSLEQQNQKERDSVTVCGLQNQELHSLLSTSSENISACLQDRYCNGILGVPITYLDKYNPEQFEIIGMLQSSTDEQAGIQNLRFYNNFREMRQDMSYTGASGGKANGNPVIKEKPKKGNFLYNEKTGEYVHSVYARIVIRRKL